MISLGVVIVLHGRLPSPPSPAHHLLARIAARFEAVYDRAYVPAIVVGLCLLGSLCYGLSSILEQREAAAAPAGKSLRIGLLTHLVQRPRWLLGNLAGIVGFALQLVALRHGSLALVQPIFVSGLVFALVGGAISEHRPLARREWLSMALVAAGLVVFLLIARTGAGTSERKHGRVGRARRRDRPQRRRRVPARPAIPSPASALPRDRCRDPLRGHGRPRRAHQSPASHRPPRHAPACATVRDARSARSRRSS